MRRRGRDIPELRDGDRRSRPRLDVDAPDEVYRLLPGDELRMRDAAQRLVLVACDPDPLMGERIERFLTGGFLFGVAVGAAIALLA